MADAHGAGGGGTDAEGEGKDRALAAGWALVVMAKAPVPGAAKTRLMPALGAQGAAALADRLLAHALAQACAALPAGAVTLACAPDTAHAAFGAAQARHPGLQVQAQVPGDLGARMHQALQRTWQAAWPPPNRPGPVLLMGTDAPAISGAMLQQAAAALHEADAVFVPAHDGGYALVGLRRPAPFLFTDMPWSTAQVMALTRQRLHAAGWRWAELPPVHDIDEPADLVHLPPELGGWSAAPEAAATGLTTTVSPSTQASRA